jgi:cytochrome c553
MPVDSAARHRRGAFGAAALALALACAAPLAGAQQPAAAPAAAAACTACHGPGGNATVREWPSLAGQPAVFLENQLVLIREGLRDIPSMKAVMGPLTDLEITALAKHFSAQPLTPQPGTPDRARAAAGAAVSARMLCGTCHLPDYSGQQQVPRLAGQNEPYLLASMKQFRDHPGPGRDTIMSASLQGLNDEQLAQLAHYLAHFKR